MALMGTCGQIGVWFSTFFLSLTGYQLTTVCLKLGILTFKRDKRKLKICENCICTFFVGAKLGKVCWLNVLRRGHKNLDAVLNRVGESEISVLNRVRV